MSEAAVGVWYFVAGSLDRGDLLGFGWDGISTALSSFYPIKADQLAYAASNLLGLYRIGNNQKLGDSVPGYIDDIWLIPCTLSQDEYAFIRDGFMTSDQINTMCTSAGSTLVTQLGMVAALMGALWMR